MSTPRLDPAEVLAIGAANKIPRDRYPVYVVALRGYRLDSVGRAGANDLGVFDDALFIVCPDPSGRGDRVIPFNGNTDPTSQKYKRATLSTGIHIYGIGPHNVSKGRSRMYPAFRQAEIFTVTRHGFGDRRFSGFFGINLHKAWGRFGSRGGTSSWGCQTLPTEEWSVFKPTLDALLRQHANERTYTDLGLWNPGAGDWGRVPTFPYILIEETERRKGNLIVSTRYH
jgi:lysozyme